MIMYSDLSAQYFHYWLIIENKSELMIKLNHKIYFITCQQNIKPKGMLINMCSCITKNNY